MNENFYTLTSYMHNLNLVTYAMEDYLEMIYRQNLVKNDLTITSLSSILHVKKSSCSKMISKLKNLKLVYSENNHLYLTKEGTRIGSFLYKRHLILEKFFKKLNKEAFKLEQVEKIEHFIDIPTLENLKKLTKLIN